MPEGYTVRDPDFDARVRGSFGRQSFMHHIGAEIEDLTAGRCVLSVPLTAELTQQHGFFHGGVIASLADNAGAYAAFTLIGAKQSMLTVEFKVNLLTPGRGEKLTAIGEVIRAGRSLSVSRVSIFVTRGVAKTQCAEALVTMMTLVERGDR